MRRSRICSWAVGPGVHGWGDGVCGCGDIHGDDVYGWWRSGSGDPYGSVDLSRTFGIYQQAHVTVRDSWAAGRHTNYAPYDGEIACTQMLFST